MTRVMRRALSYAATFGALVVGHAEDPDLSEGAAMTEGEFATRMGLPAGTSAPTPRAGQRLAGLSVTASAASR